MIEDYRIGNEIYRGINSVVSIAQAKTSDEYYVCKRSISEYPAQDFISGLEKEYYILKKLNANDDKLFFDLIYAERNVFLISPHFGMPLPEYLASGTPRLADKISLAITIAIALEKIHAAGFIHTEINPRNVLVQNNQATIIDFHKTIPNKPDHVSVDLNRPDQELPFLAPEQTGFINAPIDFRTDLYSLGGVLFYLFTENPPVSSTSPIESIHQILTSNIRETPIDLPLPAIKEIITKLLEKEPRNRYQSVSGLIHDLNQTATSLTKSHTPTPSTVGKKDVRMALNVENRLLGRQEQLRILSRFLNEDGLSMVTIEGAAGVGKTTLINHFIQNNESATSLFVIGKCDQYQRNIPYYSIKNSLNSWVSKLLDSSSEVRQDWIKKLNLTFGNNLGILTELIPEIEVLLGNIPPVVISTLRAKQQRFEATLKALIELLSQVYEPFLLILDDIQWLDKDSFALISKLIELRKTSKLKICLSFRKEEITRDHPLNWLRSKIPPSISDAIELGPLTADDNLQLVESCFQPGFSNLSVLADFVYTRTKGNPFYGLRIIEDLKQEGWIYYKEKESTWYFDKSKSGKYPIAENLLGLLQREMTALDEKQKYLIGLSACLGTYIDTDTAMYLGQNRLPNLETDFRHLIQMGYLQPMAKGPGHRGADRHQNHNQNNISNSILTFTHDKIQEAAYQLLSESDRRKVHIDFIEYALNKMPAEQELPIILEHFKAIEESLPSNLESTYFSLLDSGASFVARSMQFEAASGYLQSAIALIDKGLQKSAEILAELHNRIGQYKALTYREDEAKHNFNRALEISSSRPQKLSIFKTMAALSEKNVQMAEALELGLRGVKLYHLNFPKNPSIRWVYARFMLGRVLLKLKLASNVQLNTINRSDKEAELVHSALLEIATYGYAQNTDYYAISISHIISRSLKFGNTASSSVAYIALAMIFQHMLDDYKSNKEYGELARNIVSNSNQENIVAKVDFSYYAFIHHWHHPLEESISPLYDSHQQCIDSGELVFAGLALSFQFCKKFLTNVTLQALDDEAIELIEKGRSMHDHSGLLNIESLHNTILKLRKGPADTSEVIEYYNFDHHNTDSKSHIGKIAFANLYFYAFSFDVEKAWNEIVVIGKDLDNSMGFFEVSIYYTFRIIFGEILCHRHKNKAFIRGNNSLERKLQSARNNCHQNIHHLLLIVEAVKKQYQNEPQIEKYYDLAIQEAHKNKLIQFVGLYNEFAGRYMLSIGQFEQGHDYMKRAAFAYQQWGAEAMVSRINHTFSISSTQENKSELRGKMTLEGVLKAAEIIGQEIQLEQFVSRLMELLARHAGANAAQLVILENDKPRYHIHTSIKTKELQTKIKKITDPESLDLNSSIKQTLITRNESSAQPIRSANGEQTLKSRIATPILFKNDMVGVLYLENWHLPNAFTEERLRVLRVLSGQIAVSMRNILLVEHLEEKIVERTTTISKQKSELEDKNRLITDQLRIKDELAEAKNEIQNKTIIELQQKAEIRSVHARMDGQESERQKIAESLHNSVASLLSGAKMQLENIRHQTPDKVLPEHSRCLALIHDAAMATRKISHNLTALTLWQMGLCAACEEFLEKISSNSLKVYFSYEVIEPLSNRQNELTVFRIIQELVNNVMKHSRATILRININEEGDKLLIEVSDNGIGYSNEEVSSRSTFGLNHIRARTRHLGGDYRVSSSGSGTSTFISIPIKVFAESFAGNIEIEKS